MSFVVQCLYFRIFVGALNRGIGIPIPPFAATHADIATDRRQWSIFLMPRVSSINAKLFP